FTSGGTESDNLAVLGQVRGGVEAGVACRRADGHHVPGRGAGLPPAREPREPGPPGAAHHRGRAPAPVGRRRLAGLLRRAAGAARTEWCSVAPTATTSPAAAPA